MNRPRRLPTFDQLVLLKCASWEQYLSEWSWAQVAFEAALQRWFRVGLFPTKYFSQFAPLSDTVSKTDTTPYPHVFSPIRSAHDYQRHLYCFEDLYVNQRWGTIMSDAAHTAVYRRTAAEILRRRKSPGGEAAESKEAALTDATLPERCQRGEVRVFIQLRPPLANRNILNANAVEAAVRRRTSRVTSGHIWAPEVAEQVALYNSFDVLITMAGSHLTNLLYTNRSDVGVLEVGLAVRDKFWRKNALQFGIKHYLYQHVGNEPSQQCYEEKKVDTRCHAVEPKNSSTIVCPPSNPHAKMWFEQWNSIGDCSFTVNIKEFDIQFTRILDLLCSGK